MKKTILFALLSILTSVVFIFQSCGKDKNNDPSICKITSPSNGQEIPLGLTFTIYAEANDIDGSISEVVFFVDGVEKDYVSGHPYKYAWITDDESIGVHQLVATSYDDSGYHTSDTISVKITESVDNGTGSFIDPRDEQTYATVDIGSQTWMAENLNYETTNSWTYNYDSTTGDIYGRLYTWEAAYTACPNGWSLPSDDEWKTLEMEVGMSQGDVNKTGIRGIYEGGKMKEAGTSHWYSPNTGATNSSGFTALPGGQRTRSGSFDYFGTFGTYWSSTEDSDTTAWRRYLHCADNQMRRYATNKKYGFSIRCLKD